MEGSAVAAQMRSATPLHQILSQQQMVSSFHCNIAAVTSLSFMGFGGIVDAIFKV